jgi:uncharacterized C2H2 Zn-finger protein
MPQTEPVIQREEPCAYICNQCNKTFSHKKTLGQHLFSSHNIIYDTMRRVRKKFNKHLQTDINLLTTFFSCTPRLMLDMDTTNNPDEHNLKLHIDIIDAMSISDLLCENDTMMRPHTCLMAN